MNSKLPDTLQQQEIVNFQQTRCYCFIYTHSDHWFYNININRAINVENYVKVLIFIANVLIWFVT